jgi:hypothetical protein
MVRPGMYAYGLKTTQADSDPRGVSTPVSRDGFRVKHHGIHAPPVGVADRL